MEEEAPSTNSADKDQASSCCWDELASSLYAVKSPESFSYIKTYPCAVNPVIQVHEDIIALPLTGHGAEIIKQADKNANVQNGTQVALDEGINSVWKLDAKKFNLLNPDWSSFLRTGLDDACEGLGITESVDIQPYELLLCEQGGFYQWRHKMRETMRMVAMLAIYLPSAHQGGEIRLRYGGKRCTFDTSKSSMFTTRALAWSSNAAYDEEKLLSGRRLMLIYKIVDKSATENSSSHIDQPIEIVGRALHQCATKVPNFSAKIYLLDYHYPRVELILDKLKGHDRAVGDALNELCAGHGLHFFLGRLDTQRTTLGSSATDSGTCESLFSVELLDGFHGVHIAKNVLFTKDQLINDPHRDGRVADISPSFRGRLSRGAAAIICPTIHLPSYLYPPQNANFHNIILVVLRDIVYKPSAQGHPGDYLRVLREMVDSTHFPELSPGTFSKVLKWAWGKRYVSLFWKIISREIGLRVDPERMSAIAHIINADILENADIAQIQWDRYFSGVFCHTQDFKNVTLNLEIVQNRIRDDLKLSFEGWKKPIQQHIFRKKLSLNLGDVDYLLHSVMPAKESLDWVLNCIVPALRAQDRRDLLRMCICLLLERRENGSLANAKEIADKIILYTYRTAALETVDFDGEAYLSSLAKGFRDLIGSCLHAGLKTAVIMLLDASWTNIAPQHANPGALPLKECSANIKEFLQDLGGLLKDHNFPYISSTKEIFKLLIRRYVYAEAPTYPEKLPGWTHKLRGCGCEICLELDKFLQSEFLIKTEFSVGDTSHLKSRLPRDVFRFVHKPTEQRADLRVYWVYKIKGKEFQQDAESYNEQVLEFEKYFEALRNDYMQGLFGEADYRHLIMLEKVQNSEGQKQLKVAAAAARKKGLRMPPLSDSDDERSKKRRLK
ncbi:hypothetical protein FHL15_009809 [Xylaria flabelliformis]|uniref:Uncharacterized protein n=1 Tax=Xylaria flabelliformis TaxID=2512241 RepID=A0A553HN37_9PEZI|nr:hypothetical protein FHL15_009809 [Xylaria flabelliformis]